jgi:hypothetical protein
MASRLAEPDTSNDAFSYLYAVFDGVTGWGGGVTDPAEAKMASARWRAFIAAHRSGARVRPAFLARRPAITADLVPRVGR